MGGAVMTGQVLLGVAAIVLALSGLWVWWSHRRIRQTMARLNAMLEAAMAGDFHEETFDESQLSELESRMAQYLGAGATSAGALKRQRDQLNGLVSDVSHQTKTPLQTSFSIPSSWRSSPLHPKGRIVCMPLRAKRPSSNP